MTSSTTGEVGETRRYSCDVGLVFKTGDVTWSVNCSLTKEWTPAPPSNCSGGCLIYLYWPFCDIARNIYMYAGGLGRGDFVSSMPGCVCRKLKEMGTLLTSSK